MSKSASRISKIPYCEGFFKKKIEPGTSFKATFL